MNALVGGQVDYMCDQIVNAVPQINGGTIKAYAHRHAGAQSVAARTCRPRRKAGLPDFQASAWNALFAPEGHAEGGRRQARRRARQGARRRGRPASACSISAATFRARTAARPELRWVTW